MAATTLTAIIRGLPGTYRERLSALTVERDADGRWCAILTYALALPGIADSETGPYRIALDTHDLPPGVRAWARVRVPDSIHALEIDGESLDPQAVVDTMFLELAALDLGTLDVARFDCGGAPRWVAKTHAGSESERVAWMRSITG